MLFTGSIPALVTPMRDGRVDETALADLVDWLIEEGSSGVVPTGTTGESSTLSHAEHNRVVEITIETSGGRVPIIAGAGSNSTAEAIQLAQHAEKARADAVLLVTPYYNRPSQLGLKSHFSAVHEATNIPIIIYNIPGRSAVDMLPETMAELARLPRIAGVKDATGDMGRASIQRQLCGDSFVQLSGDDASTLGFYAHGGMGAISVTANVAPRLCGEFHKAAAEGDYAKALHLHDKLMPLHEAMFCEPSPAPAKYALSILGKCSDELRLPLTTLTDSGKKQVDEAMKLAGIIG